MKRSGGTLSAEAARELIREYKGNREAIYAAMKARNIFAKGAGFLGSLAETVSSAVVEATRGPRFKKGAHVWDKDSGKKLGVVTKDLGFDATVNQHKYVINNQTGAPRLEDSLADKPK
jgi:hypothetical protein